MKYRTKADLRKHFTAEQFAELEAKREELIEQFMINWKSYQRKIAPASLLDRATKMELITAHWIISYGNSELTFLPWTSGSAFGFDDEHFEKLTKSLNADGMTYIKARHATVSVPARD